MTITYRNKIDECLANALWKIEPGEKIVARPVENDLREARTYIHKIKNKLPSAEYMKLDKEICSLERAVTERDIEIALQCATDLSLRGDLARTQNMLRIAQEKAKILDEDISDVTKMLVSQALQIN